jgi:hypothetical protein
MRDSACPLALIELAATGLRESGLKKQKLGGG